MATVNGHDKFDFLEALSERAVPARSEQPSSLYSAVAQPGRRGKRPRPGSDSCVPVASAGGAATRGASAPPTRRTRRSDATEFMPGKSEDAPNACGAQPPVRIAPSGSAPAPTSGGKSVVEGHNFSLVAAAAALEEDDYDG